MATPVAEEVGSTSAPSSTFGVPWPHLNDGLIYTDIVKPGNQAPTLIEFYSSNYPNSAPLQGWLQRIQNEQIRVDGEVVTDPGAVLSAGSEVVYYRLPWEEPHAPYLLGVLYEDDDMLALDKPAGLQVLPGGLFQQRTVLTQLQWRSCKGNSSLCTNKLASEDACPVPVHRLGRGTSGILLCAKTKLARTRLASYFARGTSGVNDNSLQACRTSETEFVAMRGILKLYRALVTGIVDRDEVIIKQPIGVMHYPGVAKGLYVACPSGKSALSKVTVLQRDVEENQTLVQVEIHSGRPHQIRIHLAFIGYPLSGDPLYITGGRPKCFESESTEDNFAKDGGYNRPLRPVPGDCGFYLNAHHLTFYHPSTNEKIELTSPTPPMLQTREELDQKIHSER